MSRAEGDIVITVGGNVSPLTDAMGRAERTLGKLNTATQRADKQFRAMVGTSSELQSRINALTGFSDRLAKSAEKSASAFEGFRDAQRNVDRLRASFDPIYAASKQYEAAVEQLDDAMAKGVITQAQYASMVEKLAQKQLAATSASGRLADGMTKTTGASRNLGHQVQNASYQVGDFFVQIASGTDATRALAQQLPQLLGAFGVFGAVAGAAVAIGGALIPMYLGTAAGADKAKSSLDKLNEAISATQSAQEAANMTLTQARIKYGELADEALRAAQAVYGEEMANAQAKLTTALEVADGKLMLFLSRMNEGGRAGVAATKALGDQFQLTAGQAKMVADGIEAIRTAGDLKSQVQAADQLSQLFLQIYGTTEKMPPEIKAIYNGLALSVQAGASLAAVSFDNIGAAADEAERLADNLFRAAQQKIADAGMVYSGRGGDPRTSNSQGYGEFGRKTTDEIIKEERENLASGKKKGGGGGGKKEDPKEKLADFQKTLMTEGELEALNFQERLKQLKEFNAAKLLSQTEYNATLEKLQQQHQDRMAEIDVYRYGDGLQKAGAFMGDMASALQSGNEKMQKISQKFAAAEALVNAWRAFSQTLADPSLPFAAKFKAAGSVFAAAMGAVKSIKSGSETSAGKSSSAAATGGQQAYQPVTANIHWQGDMTPASMTSLTEKLNREYKQGYRLNFVGA